ncbi:MAG: hypothetical protein QOJ52_1355 [Acidimicrobiaceae bacterium]|jgi:hypothetical protein|nr:hypothetical protein [Acidimicrobiaceae bacterium]MDQ1419393.1 hypothetical protein [Acidimicrobiaceae bacterium]MDQ1443524.1 hypothetical protein [Acidimicrobiaceae bacterium]
MRINAWFNAYYRPRPEWPMWVAPDGTADEERAWVDEGAAMAHLLALELSAGFQVVYGT